MPAPGYTNQMCMVRGSRLMISFGSKGIFRIEKQFHLVLTSSDYSIDKCNIWIADEIDMTPLQVRYSRSKFLPQTQSGTPSTINLYPMKQSAWLIWMSCACECKTAVSPLLTHWRNCLHYTIYVEVIYTVRALLGFLVVMYPPWLSHIYRGDLTITPCP